MTPAIIVWHRWGEEHSEDAGFRVNSTEVVEERLRGKVEAVRNTPVDERRRWQVLDDLLLEHPWWLCSRLLPLCLVGHRAVPTDLPGRGARDVRLAPQMGLMDSGPSCRSVI